MEVFCQIAKSPFLESVLLEVMKFGMSQIDMFLKVNASCYENNSRKINYQSNIEIFVCGRENIQCRFSSWYNYFNPKYNNLNFCFFSKHPYGLNIKPATFNFGNSQNRSVIYNNNFFKIHFWNKMRNSVCSPRNVFI